MHNDIENKINAIIVTIIKVVIGIGLVPLKLLAKHTPTEAHPQITPPSPDSILINFRNYYWVWIFFKCRFRHFPVFFSSEEYERYCINHVLPSCFSQFFSMYVLYNHIHSNPNKKDARCGFSSTVSIFYFSYLILAFAILSPSSTEFHAWTDRSVFCSDPR